MSSQPAARRDQSLPRAERRARGSYYTPAAVVKYIVGETVTTGLWRDGPPAVLDPACGDGAFLCDVAERLVAHFGSDAARLGPRTLFGIDRDSVAVADACRNVATKLLAETASERRMAQLAATLQKSIIVADALLDPLPRQWPQHFDAVVGNPPYVNIRRLARDPPTVARYRERFRCAEGRFDLYVLFLERALELLRPGGRCGMIVPNKLATLDYSAACRQMLIQQTRLHTLADLSGCDLFSAASVYPHVLVFEKAAAKRGQRVRVVRGEFAAGAIRVKSVARTPQSQFNRRGVFDWQEAFDVESRVPTRPLDELCRLHSGTTGFVAQQIAAKLREREDCKDRAFPFITSGNIDRYAIASGNVRYMKRTFLDPVLPQDCSLLSAAKRRLFAGPKIVFAGMSRQLEAAYHAGNLSLGVQVFAAADWQVDPYYLLALLNSRLMSHLFRTRFAAKKLAGGYLSINKGQLAQLPVVDPSRLTAHNRRPILRISALGEQLSQHFSNDAVEAEIEALVNQLYGLQADEVSLLTSATSLLAAA